MKPLHALPRILAVMAIACSLRGSGTNSSRSLPAQFIVINREPRQPWDSENPESFQRAQFDEIQRAIPAPKGTRARVGVSFIFSYLANTNSSALTNSLRRFLALAAETDTPVCVALDGEYWWQGRPDLWNWWDTNHPGFNPANRENVEWSSWSSADALKLAWLNWGQQMRMLPPPNLLSPRYREACREQLRLLVPIVVNWWHALPAEKQDLFVGLKVSWESAIGVNGYYYTNGNAFLNQPPANDPRGGIRGRVVPSRGVAQIGYAAVKTGGIRNRGEITEADLAEVVRRHVEDYSREAAQLGLPRDRIFTHVGGWKEGELLFDAAVNQFSSPGWSFYGRGIEPTNNIGIQRALKLSDAPCWAASEWLHQGTNTVEAWHGSLERTLADPRCRFLNIFNWSGIRNNTNALEAIRIFVADSGPPAAANTESFKAQPPALK